MTSRMDIWRAANVGAVNSVLSGGATLFSKYGNGGFTSPPDESGLNEAYKTLFPGFDFSQAG